MWVPRSRAADTTQRSPGPPPTMSLAPPVLSSSTPAKPETFISPAEPRVGARGAGEGAASVCPCSCSLPHCQVVGKSLSFPGGAFRVPMSHSWGGGTPSGCLKVGAGGALCVHKRVHWVFRVCTSGSDRCSVGAQVGLLGALWVHKRVLSPCDTPTKQHESCGAAAGTVTPMCPPP